jgi:hypothetical protein
MQGDPTTTPHPWRELRALGHVTVHFVELSAGVWGLSTGGRIWITTGLSQAERRCTLAHELEHQRRGHEGCQPPAVEAEVSQAAARRLIPFDALLDALRWARNLHELADELWVDEDTVRVRLEHLHPSERMKIVAMREERGG